jgi:hypothetical protein
MRQRHKLKLLLVVTGAGLFLAGWPGSPLAGAVSSDISHSYHSEGGTSNGSLVSLDPKRSDYVQLANTANSSRLIGVIVAPGESLLAVDASPATVQVATAGTVSVLVSTLDGPIAAGDHVSVSPFDGIGIKAVPGSYVIGLAQTGLNSRSADTVTLPVTNKSGQTTKITVGYVRVSIAIGPAPATSADLNSVQRLAQSLTGHRVATFRVVISIVIALGALFTLVTLIYASIYSSIISIGRNPLAKYEVLRTLTLVMGMALLTAGVAASIIYLLLR